MNTRLIIIAVFAGLLCSANAYSNDCLFREMASIKAMPYNIPLSGDMEYWALLIRLKDNPEALINLASDTTETSALPAVPSVRTIGDIAVGMLAKLMPDIPVESFYSARRSGEINALDEAVADIKNWYRDHRLLLNWVEDSFNYRGAVEGFAHGKNPLGGCYTLASTETRCLGW